MSKKQQGRKPIGRGNPRRQKATCGICGQKKLMTKAHVPPQCAGNAMLTKRYRFMAQGDEVNPGRSDLGGIHLYGLCVDCNGLASRYDGAYGDFAAAIKQRCWVKTLTLHLPDRITMPDIELDPGSVVRSILLGMCATGTLLVEHWPGLPMSLTTGDPVALPNDMKLYIALARGFSARVAGSIFGFHVTGPHERRNAEGRQIGIMALASVYFPPLAWELVHTGENILDELGWVDVSDWTQLRPGDTHVLTQLVPALPAVCHPWHHPTRSEHWTEVFNSDLVPIVECANIEGGEPDPASPLTLSMRAYVTTKQVHELARQKGIVPRGAQ